MDKLHCFAVTLPGLETIVADELAELSVDAVRIEEGGVSFDATMDGLWRVNLRIRSATRILVRLATFRVHSFPELYNKARKISWERYFGPDSRPELRATSHKSKLMHTGRIAKAVEDAITSRLIGEDDCQGECRAQQLLVRMQGDLCTISIDSSGERLDRRGYRLHSGRAPLRETIAAAILKWIAWQPNEPLLLPMCGSGTFAVEAVWMAQQRAPGLGHDFSFKYWPSFKQKRWLRVYAKSEAMQRDLSLEIHASDLDDAILEQARQNALAAGVNEKVHFTVADIRAIRPIGEVPGVIVCNPPYGDRIGDDVRSIYRELGALFREHFEGWRIAIIVADQGCELALAMPVRQRLKIKHGGKWVYLLYL